MPVRAEAGAGLLLAMNICVVCFSVIARYVYHEQYAWADEVARAPHGVPVPQRLGLLDDDDLSQIGYRDHGLKERILPRPA